MVAPWVLPCLLPIAKFMLAAQPDSGWRAGEPWSFSSTRAFAASSVSCARAITPLQFHRERLQKVRRRISGGTPHLDLGAVAIAGMREQDRCAPRAHHQGVAPADTFLHRFRNGVSMGGKGGLGHRQQLRRTFIVD